MALARILPHFKEKAATCPLHSLLFGEVEYIRGNHQAMTAIPFEIKLDNATQEGDCTGHWVAQTKYAYKVSTKPDDPDICIFVVHGRLNLEFEKGGSMEYFLHAGFGLAEYGTKPLLMQLMDIASQAYPMIENEFYDSDCADRNPKEKLWQPDDDQHAAMAIGSELIAAFPSK
jgi:hypothetical protein